MQVKQIQECTSDTLETEPDNRKGRKEDKDGKADQKQHVTIKS